MSADVDNRERITVRLMRDERGSAMTEFVIGLPIYILIFAGIGMLYKYNNEGMIARMKTIQDLSNRTRAVNNFVDFIPNTGGSIFVSGLGDIDFPGSGQAGIYVDSARKANIGDQFGVIKSPAAPPTSSIPAITGNTGSFGNRLLDDANEPIGNVDGWAEIIRGIINLAGVNPSIGAGIRYTPIVSETTHTFSHPWTGSTTYAPGRADLPAPTAATHRAFPVALARLEMNSREPYKSGLLEFNLDIVDNEMGASGSLPAGSNFNQAAGDDCANQATDYGSCMQDPANIALAEASSNCGLLGLSQCNIQDICEDLTPDDSCNEMAEGTDVFNSPQCDGMGPDCARPQEDDRSTAYDNIDFQEYP